MLLESNVVFIGKESLPLLGFATYLSSWTLDLAFDKIINLTYDLTIILTVNLTVIWGVTCESTGLNSLY